MTEIPPAQAPLRLHLLQTVRTFVRKASTIEGVSRIALIGSLTTEKKKPKDADVLVTITSNINIEALAASGRQLKGKGQNQNSGADIFLCDTRGNYLGRTCSYKECHDRASCQGNQCGPGNRICNDFHILQLTPALILEPPLELWPHVTRRQPIPQDVEIILLDQ